MRLEQTINLPGLGIDIDIKIARSGWQAWDSLDVRSKCIPV